MTLHVERPALLPLRGLRFHATDLAPHIGPPTDIASSAEARAFVRDRPLNAVRLELADDNGALRFNGARALLTTWRRDGVLQRDAVASYYVYEQEFDDRHSRRVRRGIFGLAPVDLPEVCVLPHEDTWEDNLARRTQLLRDLHATLSPIFLLYEDSGNLPELLDELTARRPDAEGVDLGETHRLWRVSDSRDMSRVAEHMRGRHFVIADGHHRFAAARIYHTENPSPGTGVILACCVAADDPGVVIRSIHRTLAPELATRWESALETLARWFDVKRHTISAATGWDILGRLEGLQPCMALIAPDGETFVTLRLRDWAAAEALLPLDIVEPARRLDVTLAAALVLERAFGASTGTDHNGIDHTNDPDEALADVRAGRAGAALLLRAPQLNQVLAIARAGGRMPPKSTSFIPKTPIGLVMHDFQSPADV